MHSTSINTHPNPVAAQVQILLDPSIISVDLDISENI